MEKKSRQLIFMVQTIHRVQTLDLPPPPSLNLCVLCEEQLKLKLEALYFDLYSSFLVNANHYDDLLNDKK